jgi:ABC-type multidrug transport system permease subunit
VRTLRVIQALAVRSIKQTFRRPQFLAPILLFPSVLLAVNVGNAGSAVDLPQFPDSGFLDFELAGSMLQGTMLAGVSGGIALALDIELGFSDRLIAAPISRFAMVLGRLAATGVFGALTACWFLLGGLIFGAEIEAGLPGAALIVALVALTSIAFGGIGAALALKSGTVSVVQGVFPIVFVILFLSSAFFPEVLMTEPARTIAEYNPFSYLAEGFRDPVISSISIEPLAKCLGSLALIGAIGIGLSGVALRSRLRTG